MNNEGYPDHVCGGCYCDEEPAEDRCHTCGERIPEGAGGFVPGEGMQCQDCLVEWREAAREEATVVA